MFWVVSLSIDSRVVSLSIDSQVRPRVFEKIRKTENPLPRGYQAVSLAVDSQVVSLAIDSPFPDFRPILS